MARIYLSLKAPDATKKWRGIHKRDRARLIKLLKLRDGDKCAGCNEPFYEESDITIDHKIARCLGGRDEKRNYQLLCRKCNEAKGAEEQQLVNQIRRAVK